MIQSASENKTERYPIKRMLQLILEVAALGYIIYYIVTHRSEVTRLLDLKILDVVIVFTLLLLGNAIRSWELAYILRSLDTKIRFMESGYITMGSTLLNYLPMNAGTIVKARVLKKHRDLKYAHFISVMSATILILLFASGVLGLLAVLISGLSMEPQRSKVLPMPG